MNTEKYTDVVTESKESPEIVEFRKQLEHEIGEKKLKQPIKIEEEEREKHNLSQMLTSLKLYIGTLLRRNANSETLSINDFQILLNSVKDYSDTFNQFPNELRQLEMNLNTLKHTLESNSIGASTNLLSPILFAINSVPSIEHIHSVRSMLQSGEN